MEGALLLDVVVAEGTAVFQLLTREDQALLVRWDAFLVLDLALDIVNRIRGLNLEGDGLSGDCDMTLADAQMVMRLPGAVSGGVLLTSLHEDLHLCGCVWCGLIMFL